MIEYEFQITPEPLLPAPCPWWRRIWLKLRRKPLPTIQPAGTQPVTFEYTDAAGIQTRMYFPAARISTTPEANSDTSLDDRYGDADDGAPH